MASAAPLKIDLLHQGEVCVLRLSGRFAAGLEPELVSRKLEEVKAAACGRLLVDLAGMTAIGSIGVGFLVALYTSVTNASGRFVMTGANARVQDVLRLTRLNTVLPQATDFEAGVVALKA